MPESFVSPVGCEQLCGWSERGEGPHVWCAEHILDVCVKALQYSHSRLSSDCVTMSLFSCVLHS